MKFLMTAVAVTKLCRWTADDRGNDRRNTMNTIEYNIINLRLSAVISLTGACPRG